MSVQPKISYLLESGISLGCAEQRMPERPFELGRMRHLVAACLRPGNDTLDLNEVDPENDTVRAVMSAAYLRSNEGYTAGLRNVLSGLSGVQEYVGICGGGDQNKHQRLRQARW